MKLTLILIGLFFSLNVYAKDAIYNNVSTAMEIFAKSYEKIKMPQGVDYNSKETFKNSKGKVESVTHMYMEGPLKDKKVNTFEKAIDFTAHIISNEVSPDYKVKNMLSPGLGLTIIDINGFNVAVFDYKVSHEPNTYAQRAAIVTENGFYSYSITMHNAKPKDQRIMIFMAMIIASINSGAL